MLLKQGFELVEVECVGGVIRNFEEDASRSQAKSGTLWIKFERKINRMDEGQRSDGSVISSPMKLALGNLWSRLMAVRSRCPVVRHFAGSTKNP